MRDLREWEILTTEYNNNDEDVDYCSAEPDVSSMERAQIAHRNSVESTQIIDFNSILLLGTPLNQLKWWISTQQYCPGGNSIWLDHSITELSGRNWFTEITYEFTAWTWRTGGGYRGRCISRNIRDPSSQYGHALCFNTEGLNRHRQREAERAGGDRGLRAMPRQLLLRNYKRQLNNLPKWILVMYYLLSYLLS